MNPLLASAAAWYGAAWELRRALHARGVLRPERVAARVVSIGNLTVGGTGKTTLALHLGGVLARLGEDFAIVCRRYRPGPAGFGDEELMYARAFGAARVYAGNMKRDLARRAASDGHRVVLVDDGFSHWQLERDVNLVLLDATDPWGGGQLLPAGRMREPRRALQRADAVIVSRVRHEKDAAAVIADVLRFAPAALGAAGRHAIIGVRSRGGEVAPPGTRVWIVTATGNPQAVEHSALEAGLDVAGMSRYRDHHWFRPGEMSAERARAGRAGAQVLVTSKDAVRWPDADRDVLVLEVEWQWLAGQSAIESAIAGPR